MNRMHLAHAAGSPSATAVVRFEDLPDPGEAVTPPLQALRRAMVDAGHRDVTKIALIGSSARPGFDLDYRFVQVIPGATDGFDLRGSCGHSILAASTVARQQGWVADGPVQVHVRNNGDQVTCRPSGEDIWDVFFHRRAHTPLPDLLLHDGPRTTLRMDGRPLPVSLVSAGNPYVFVSAFDLDIQDPPRLFDTDDPLFAAMSRLRLRACDHLGWPPEGVFPKIAALLPMGQGRIAVRAISVPRWHPTMALTGAMCLAAAANIPGTVAHQAAGSNPAGYSALTIHTAHGIKHVGVDVGQPGGLLRSVGVLNSAVRLLESAATASGASR
jgi:hypothetical protein